MFRLWKILLAVLTIEATERAVIASRFEDGGEKE